MSFGSFLRGVVAQVNPLDNGRTYGTYNPPQKKRPDQPIAVQPVIRPANLTNNIPTTHSPLSFGTLKINNVVAPPSKQYTDQNKPIPYKAVDVGADVAANVASGFGEGISKLVGAPLSLASLVARKISSNQGNIEPSPIVNTIDKINAPSRIGNSIAGARKEVDVSAQNEGINTPYKVGSVVGSTALAVPAVAEGISKLGQIPKIVTNLPKTAATLRAIGKAGGGELLPKVRSFFRGNPAEDVAVDAGGVGEATQIPVQNASPGTVPIPVRKPIPIPITDVSGIDTPLPTVVKPPTKLIQEVSGDATTAESAAQKATQQANQKAIDRFKKQIESQGKSDQRIEGVTGLKKSDVTEARNTLDDALNTNKITEDDYKLLNKELDNIEKPPTTGKPISVRQIDTIPVQQVNDVPVNVPETPGKVRVTKTTDPVKAQTEAIAAQTSTATAPTPPLPADVQAVLDNPTQFNKRQVAAARRQRDLAKQYAKAQAEKQAVIDNSPQLSPKPEGNRGFVKTNEIAQGRHGAYEKVNAQAEAAQGARDANNLSVSDVLTQADQDMLQQEQIAADTARNLKAKIQDPSIPKNTPEGKALLTAYHEALTKHAQTLAIADKVVRRSSTGDQIANRFVNKLILTAQDTSKLTDAEVATVKQAENAFTDARDAANAAAEQFRATGSTADLNAWNAAFKQQQLADKASRTAEYNVAKRVLKGDSSPQALKAIQQAESDTGAYSMDYVDSSMLSGTGTMVRNTINPMFPRLENRLFGKASSIAVRKLGTVGGSSREGAKLGAEVGKAQFKADKLARKEAGVGFIRRTITAGNTLGDKHIEVTAYSKGFDYYKQVLAKEGYTGQELTNRAKFSALTDPEGEVAKYKQDALDANALSSITHSKKIENWLADTVQKKLADANYGYSGQIVARNVAKGATRVGIGFPTIIAKSLLEGAKRATFGVPEAAWSTAKYLKSARDVASKQQFAEELAKEIQHFGTGATLFIMGHVLSNLGVISGPYPSDKNERDRWTVEGRQPNSIKIGGNWFNIPGYLGGFALPLMTGAATGGGSSIKDAATFKNVYQSALDASPVDNIQSTLDILTGRASDSKIKNAVTSLVRTATPAGAFVAEIAKLLDPTKNDTTTKSTLMNIIDQVASGIPIVNNLENTTPATDSYGNVIKNPNPIATVFGAQGAEQPQGVQDVQQAQNDANATYSQLKDFGVLDNKNLMGLVDKKIQAQISRGQDLKPEDVKSVQKAVTKGIGTGISADSDSNWRENGDYATDRTAMKVKMSILEADPTAKKSEINNLKVQIARDDVLEKNQIPYDMLKLYERTSQTDWGHMGNPKETDSYDPDTYNKLKQIDDLLTAAGGSYKDGDPTKNKFNPKGAGTGYSDKVKPIETSFGTISSSGNPFAPKVREYQTADLSGTGGIPVVNVVRPNIVHQIKTGQV